MGRLQLLIVNLPRAEVELAGAERMSDALHEELDRYGLGEVQGYRPPVIGRFHEIYVLTRRPSDALAVLTRTLEALGAPAASDIKQHEPEIAFHKLYGQPSHRAAGTFEPPHRGAKLKLKERPVSKRKGPRQREVDIDPFEIPPGMETTFFEVVVPVKRAGKYSRDALEEGLTCALTNASLGEITGAGTGGDAFNLDVEVLDRDAGLSVLIRELKRLSAPEGTCIHEPARQLVHHVYSPRD
jgi:hypothetical protein